MTENEDELIEIIRQLMLQEWISGIMSSKTAIQMVKEKLEDILKVSKKILIERGD